MRSRPASPAYARCRHDRLRAESRDRQLDHALSRCVASDDSATRNAAKRGRSRRGRRAITRRPRACPRAPRSACRARRARAACRPPRTGSEHPHALPAVVEAVRELGAQLVEPLAGHRRHLRRAGEAVREPAAPERVDAVDLVQDDVVGNFGGADLAAGSARRRHADDPARRRPPTRRSRAGSGRRRASPRASTRSPRRAACGSRRMKPTVSVTR